MTPGAMMAGMREAEGLVPDFLDDGQPDVEVTLARVGMTGQARAMLAALDDEQTSSGEIRNARVVICLAEGDPAAALAAVAGVADGSAPVLGYVTVVEAHLLAGLAHRELGDARGRRAARTR